MSQWGWVTLSYAVTYVSFAVFAGSIAYRIRRRRRQLEELE
jgi:hypothetical protein